MLFNSFEFVQFMAVVFVLYYLAAWCRLQVLILLVSSLIFYSAKQPTLLILLFASMFGNALFSWLIARGPERTRYPLLVSGISLNLAVLALFKYGPLFLPANYGKLPLPIGISFFTFEAIMILAESWRSPKQPQLGFFENLARVGLLMSFFPHLVSGPIVKACDFFPQIVRKRLADVDWNLAFRSLTVGYFLKLVVADNLNQRTADLAYPYFLDYSTSRLFWLLVGYSAQIFADFAGYSLIAIGLAALLGYRLPENFNFPYVATSFSDFWRRWHMSLSGFLRDYLYLPLGGNRRGPARTLINIMIVMGLGGLWHGAAWSYAVWGLMHGLALVLERVLPDGPNWRIWRFIKGVMVFFYVSLAWLLFKMPNFEHVMSYIVAMVNNLDGPYEFGVETSLKMFSLPVLLYHVGHLWCPNWLRQRSYLIYGLLLFFIITSPGPPGTFIYFQF